MPKSKPSRKPVKGPTQARTDEPKPQPFVSIINPPQEIAKLHIGVINALNRIIKHEGNFQDWLNVVVRLYAGAVASNDYFKKDPAIDEAFNQATLAMRIVKIRPHVGRDFGITSVELDSVTYALGLTADMCRQMTRLEIAKCYQLASWIMDEYEQKNRLHYPSDASNDMVATLEQEMQEVVSQENQLTLKAA